MKAHARAVVIGGGIVGCSVLYHLTRLGWTDVALLERDELTSGSTWHAAGNCPNFSTSWNIMKLQSYSNRLYRRLPAEVDYAIDHRRSGSIRLAHTSARMDEFRRCLSEESRAQRYFAALGNDQLAQEARRQSHVDYSSAFGLVASLPERQGQRGEGLHVPAGSVGEDERLHRVSRSFRISSQAVSTRSSAKTPWVNISMATRE